MSIRIVLATCFVCAAVPALKAQQSREDALNNVLSGIDVLQRDGFRILAGQKVALITNQTGVTRDGESTVKLLYESDAVSLVALFSPEHGFAGKLDQAHVGDARDTTTGLKIHSLYGKTRVPTAEMLTGIDTLVFDIQDIGSRFYTYISTMGGAMKAAGRHGVRFVVLDRPNPIGGVDVQGPVLDAGSESFVGYHTIAVRHGMTVGELAKMFQSEMEIDVDLQVVPVEGWQRDQWFDATGRLWVNPSPNMRNLNQALLYPGVGLLETTNLSVGRGTDTPFEIIGAPWIDALALARRMNSAGLKGIRFVPLEFTPQSSKYEGESCGGIHFLITERSQLDPLRLGMTLANALQTMYPQQWDTSNLNRLLSDQKTADGIVTGKAVHELIGDYQAELAAFNDRRNAFLIYPTAAKP
jgi:uncharacterized protein YbbC (DUF1343 family)